MIFEQSEKTIFNMPITIWKCGGFEIHSSRHGIFLEGSTPILNTDSDLDSLAAKIAQAWKWHQLLKKDAITREDL